MSITKKLSEIEHLGGLEFISKQAVKGFISGKHKSPLNGYSVEFAEHRQYNSGEPIKHIDWKLYAKTDRLFSKKYEEETNLRCHFLLDTSPSMHYPNGKDRHTKLEFSIFAIACLIQLVKKQRDAFGLTTFSDKVRLHTVAKSSVAHEKFIYTELEKTAKLEKAKQSNVVGAIHEIAENIHKRSLVVIFSDMLGQHTLQELDELFLALQHLKHRKHEVILFHVNEHHTEIDFDFEDRPYEFIDLESSEKIKLKPNEVRESYLKSMNDYLYQIKLKCGQYHIDFIDADINKPYEDVLRQYLIKRKKVAK